jgi:hypothetical protein
MRNLPEILKNSAYTLDDNYEKRQKADGVVGIRREQREAKRIKRSFNEDGDEDDEDEFTDPEYSKIGKKLKGRKAQIILDSRGVAMSRKGSSSSKDPNRKCEVCGATETPQWRRGPSGARTLCNACGVKWSSGRLNLGPPGSPFPFTVTESEPGISSDATSGLEDIEVGTTAWKLQLEVARLKSKLREVEKNHKRLVKLLSESASTDKQIDRAYRKLISNAKKSIPRDSLEFIKQSDDLFHRFETVDEDKVKDPSLKNSDSRKRHIFFADANTKDLINEKVVTNRFKKAVQQS